MASQIIVTPILVDEGGDITLYWSVDSAALAMEAADVIAGEYDVFDSRGLRLAVLANNSQAPVEINATDLRDELGLARRLRRFIVRVGPNRVGVSDPEAVELDELVSALARFLGSAR